MVKDTGHTHELLNRDVVIVLLLSVNNFLYKINLYSVRYTTIDSKKPV